MTVTSSVKTVRYDGTGAAASLDTVFPFFSAEEVEVWLRIELTGFEFLLTKAPDGTVSGHYQLTGGGVDGLQSSSSGVVTVLDPPTDFFVGITWEIRRAVPLLQTDFDTNESDSFTALSINGAFDRTAMQKEQVNQFELLAEASSDPGGSVLTLNVAGLVGDDWSDTYDSVILELIGIYPVKQDMAIKIRTLPLATGTLQSLVSTSLTDVGGVPLTSITQPAGTWSTDPGRFVGNNLFSSVNGSITCHAKNGLIHAYGEVVYKNHPDTVPTPRSGSVAGARLYCTGVGVVPMGGFVIDGYGVAATVSDVVGQAKVWGLPKGYQYLD